MITLPWYGVQSSPFSSPASIFLLCFSIFSFSLPMARVMLNAPYMFPRSVIPTAGIPSRQAISTSVSTSVVAGRMEN